MNSINEMLKFFIRDAQRGAMASWGNWLHTRSCLESEVQRTASSMLEVWTQSWTVHSTAKTVSKIQTDAIDSERKVLTPFRLEPCR